MNKSLPSKVLAEAAAWIAELHDSERSPHLQARELHAWLREDESHRRAFDRMTQLWETTGRLQMRAQSASDSGQARPPARRYAPLVALAATVAAVAIGIAYYFRQDAVITGIGEQQAMFLGDGTRVVLNTNTRLVVNYDERARRVQLVRGEALFDVSKRPNWPFIVTVDGHEIQALGTSFIVRHDDSQDLSVTLVEGRISVAPAAANNVRTLADPQVLAAGERLTVSRNRPVTVDRPELSRVMAWESGRVEFEETPLADAAAEMNRYSTHHVTVAGAEVGQLRISGVFRSGDSEEFSRAVAATFGLQINREGHDIRLSKAVSAVP